MRIFFTITIINYTFYSVFQMFKRAETESLNGKSENKASSDAISELVKEEETSENLEKGKYQR